jgi:hypothetical protein
MGTAGEQNSRLHRANWSTKEVDMEHLAAVGQTASGRGVGLVGFAALWFVSVYDDNKK